MLLFSSASAAFHLRPLTASAHGRHASVRLLSTTPGDTSIALPKFLVTTVAPKSQDGDKFVFDRYSQSVGEMPVFLVDVKYEGKATVAAEWVDTSDHGKGKISEGKGDELGDFSGTAVSQAEFTEALRDEGKELFFNIHGTFQQTMDMVVATHNLQTNMDSSLDKPKDKDILVVPVEWACADEEGIFRSEVFEKGLLKTVGRRIPQYLEDSEANSKVAGSALWKLFSGIKKAEQKLSINVMAHSMGNRVLRHVGKKAVEGDASWNEGDLQDKSLLQAAPEDLKRNENLFENIFFVASDIPESVFDEPDGPQVEQAEHGLQSGVAALAVMTKRMHVLHSNESDGALKQSYLLNKFHARLGWRGPWSAGRFNRGGEPTKVWDKINDALESNVHVQDCSGWNKKIDANGHGYQFDPESVKYYLEHMNKGM